MHLEQNKNTMLNFKFDIKASPNNKITLHKHEDLLLSEKAIIAQFLLTQKQSIFSVCVKVMSVQNAESLY